MAQRPVNKHRGQRIGMALADAGYEGAPDWAATVTDALCDLRHLCDAHGLDFGNLDRIGYGHYQAELHASDAEAQASERHFAEAGRP